MRYLHGRSYSFEIGRTTFLEGLFLLFLLQIAECTTALLLVHSSGKYLMDVFDCQSTV